MWQGGDLQDVVETAGPDLAKLVGQIIGLGVDGVGRAQFVGQRQAGLVHVDRHDRAGRDDVRRHHRSEADRTGAEHRNGLTRVHLQ